MADGDPSTRNLLEAVTELLLRDGYEGVSVRKVAAAAGVSVGAVQYHFPTKDAMLQAAMENASQSFRRRLNGLVDHDATAEVALRTLALGLLGVDQEARDVGVLWLLRAARAAVVPSVAEVHAAEWQEVENLMAGLMWGARPDLPQAWAQDQAGYLLALIDGLAVAALIEPARMPPARARSILDAALSSVLTARPTG